MPLISAPPISDTLISGTTEYSAPTGVLQEYANTSSAGSIIAFSQNHDDLVPGDLGIICSFGAGYSVGNAIVKRL
ncbi:MAG: hypothetical protein GY925_27000 [Actinomycetia bacterium]|nr:hypothetical protein [Actinomycetes bacterium]